MVRVKITKTYKQNPSLFLKATKGDQLRFQIIRELIERKAKTECFVPLVPGILTPPGSPPVMNITPTTVQDFETLPYQCSKCGLCFKDFCSTCIQKRDERTPCSICPKVVKDLKTHMILHTKKIYGKQCPHCDRKIKDPSNFRKHLKWHKKKLGL